MAAKETEYLRARSAAHVARLGVSTFAHAVLCGCGRADTVCAVCGRDDFEYPAETLTFTGASFTCADCIDEINAAAAAE